MVEISIESVRQVRISEIEEYETEEGETDDGEPFYRSIAIETGSGILEIEISSSSRQALEILSSI